MTIKSYLPMSIVKRNEKGQLQKGSKLKQDSLAKRAGNLRAVLENIPSLSAEATGEMLADIIHGKATIRMARALKNAKKRGGRAAAQDADDMSEDTPEIEIKPTFRERIDALHLAWQYMYGKAQSNVSIDIDKTVTHSLDLSRLSMEELENLAQLQIKALPEAVDGEIVGDDDGE
jgi:hypothetical protein